VKRVFTDLTIPAADHVDKRELSSIHGKGMDWLQQDLPFRTEF
jgi:hypothetical protein